MADKPSNPSGSPGPRDDYLSGIYNIAARETPPPSIDARILAHARADLGDTRSGARSLRRWALPLSIAAMALVSVGVVLHLHEQNGGADRADRPSLARAPALQESAAPEQPPAPAASAARKRLAADAREDARGMRQEAKSGATASQKASARTVADVVSVEVRGQPGAYEFSVGVRSPDRGCDQYAQWWEVLSEDGRLLYRRVLLHSHVDEQPFVRSGGPVAIAPNTVVWVRAHMNTTGYGGTAFTGSVERGFVPASLPPAFAAALAAQPPLPDSCAF